MSWALCRFCSAFVATSTRAHTTKTYLDAQGTRPVPATLLSSQRCRLSGRHTLQCPNRWNPSHGAAPIAVWAHLHMNRQRFFVCRAFAICYRTAKHSYCYPLKWNIFIDREETNIGILVLVLWLQFYFLHWNSLFKVSRNENGWNFLFGAKAATSHFRFQTDFDRNVCNKYLWTLDYRMHSPPSLFQHLRPMDSFLHAPRIIVWQRIREDHNGRTAERSRWEKRRRKKQF